MPLVTPLTQNIVVSAPSQSTNPIILSNTHQNQMIVMQPLSSRLQNSVLPMRNQTLMKSVQKVSLNTVPSIQTSAGANSREWTSNMKNIIEATKIGGRKGILPKGKELTMAYKVPIPAIHREPVAPKVTEASDQESKIKLKRSVKTKKTQKRDKTEPEIGASVETSKTINVEPIQDTISDVAISEDSTVKKKAMETSIASEVPASQTKVAKLPETCKSIENLRHVVERIGEDAIKVVENESEAEVPDIQSTNAESSSPERAISDVQNNVVSEDCNDTPDKSIASEKSLDNPEATVKLSSPVRHEINPDHSSQPSNLLPIESPIVSSESANSPTVSETIGNVPTAIEKQKSICDLGTRFDAILGSTEKPTKEDNNVVVDTAKIILNLDTNTTTTMKPEMCRTDTQTLNPESTATVLPTVSSVQEIEESTKVVERTKDETLKSLTYSAVNTFIPIGNRAEGLHSDLSNDLFASLQVPSSSHNPESISPTAAFLMAFPLVSSLNGKTEVLEEEMKEDLKYHSQTPPMLLQIGTIEPNSFKVKNDPPAIIQTPAIEKTNDNLSSRDTVKNQLAQKVSSELPAPKALPKVVNTEAIKERLYKVVQFPQTSEHSSNNLAVTRSNNESCVTASIATCGIQSTSMIQNSSTNPAVSMPEKIETSIRKCETQNIASSSTCPKYDVSNTITNTLRPIASTTSNSSDLPKYDANVRYPSIPDYVPGYANFTSTVDTNSGRATFGMTKTVNSTQTSTSIPVFNNSTVPTYPSMRSQAVQSAYVAHTTGKDPQVSSQHLYANRSKDSIVNSTETTSYSSFPTVSQSGQHDYTIRAKDSYTVQNYDIHGKEGAQISFQGYPVVARKNSSSHDTNPSQQDRQYVTSRINDTNSSVNINVKDSVNSFQTYPLHPQNKESSVMDPRNRADNSAENQRVESTAPPQPPSSKIETNHFAQSGSYASFATKEIKQNMLVPDTMFQTKRQDSQSYIPYSRDSKKPNFDSTNSSVASVSKTQHIQNSSVARYSHQLQEQSQPQETCVATSNYCQSTVSENLIKSTTTVAHNSSNFSILSWTTFSPMSGGANNNIAQYESGTVDHVDETVGKTICENYSYPSIHKDSVTYGNMLTNESFPGHSTIAAVDKDRGKLMHESLKNFDDPSKSKSVQSVGSQQQKSSRAHNPVEDYKFAPENKNKTSNKYPVSSAYTQPEYAVQQQQHNTKAHQTIPAKPEKPNYTMSTYESHAPFELAEPNVQLKCNSEIYTGSNYKYGEEKDPNVQLKYQPHVQNQSAILHHTNSSYNNAPKHVQQQQQVTKTKTIVQQQQQQLQQQAIRPPVNWMMTPEIKHNTNIPDLILPPIGKELDYCQNNIFTQPPTYNQTTPNHQFYNNYDAAVSASHGFPNIPSLPTDPRRIGDGFYSEEQPFTWSPTKNTQVIENNQGVKSLDQHVVVPSTLPTLVGDLALGTNISEKQSFLFSQIPPRNNKEVVQSSVKDMLNTQNVQHTGQGTSFLSVSQLVEHEKAEKTHQHQNHLPHHHVHHQPTQQTQQSPQQPRKHQRKNGNGNSRGTGKRQLETRKQNNVSELHPQHTEEQKISGVHATFPDQTYHQQQQQQQVQKYQQNDVHWRNRHCKSNYTAEALIGSNTSVQDSNNQEKQLQTSTIKSFSTDYGQTKYPSGLSTSEMVMPPINYLSNNTDDGSGYGQVVNQNFNHSSYAYSPNTNIYPTTNFITSISNTPTSYMMPLHENPTDFLESNSFLLPNVTNVAATSKATVNTSSSSVSSPASTRLTTSSSTSGGTNVKNHQQQYASSAGKHQNCDKRNSYGSATKKSKRKGENNNMQNLEFPLSAVGPPLEDYHSHPHHHHHHHHHHAHASTFLAPPPHANPLYQNSHSTGVGLTTNSNRVTRGVIATGNTTALSHHHHHHHHPSGTSLTNFNLSTIFPEINDKVRASRFSIFISCTGN